MRSFIGMTAAAALTAAAGSVSGDVIITEIMYNSTGAEAESEWVEIYNTGPDPVDITGWYLDDEDGGDPDTGGSSRFPEGTIIEPGEAIVIFGTWDQDGDPEIFTTVEDFQAAWGDDFRVIQLPIMITLANSPSGTNEQLRLVDADGITVDDANYDDEGDWPSDVPQGQPPYLLAPFLNAVDNDNGRAWRRGTLGVDGGRQSNEVLAADGVTVLFGGDDIASPGFVETMSEFADCNGNEVDDIIDIFNGTSDDCDGNRIPDECQEDCDGNGVPDLCDIAGDLGLDCDLNGRIDSCEIADNPALDANNNGILDVCEDRPDIIITEILYNPRTSGDGTEFVELLNNSADPVDLSGWTLVDIEGDDPSQPFPKGTILGAGEILVLTRYDAADFNTAWGAEINVIQLDPWGARANQGTEFDEILTLADEGGAAVDIANYQSDRDPWPWDDGNASIYLLGNAIDRQDNNDGANWKLSLDPLDGAFRPEEVAGVSGRDIASPGFIPTGEPERPVGDVIISEIMYATNSSTPEGLFNMTEWVEILNVSDAPVNLSGWYLRDEDGESARIPEGTIINPDEAVVLIPDDEPTNEDPIGEFETAWCRGFQVVPLAGWSGGVDGGLNNLSNGPNPGNEILTLRRADDSLSDVVNYDDDGVIWPTDGSDLPGEFAWSINLLPGNYDELRNDSGFNWIASLEGFKGARLNEMTEIFNGMEFGSPGFVEGVTDPGIIDCSGGEDCLADWDGNGVVNAADVGAFLSTYFVNLNDGGLEADFDGNGIVNAADVGAFLSEYFATLGECP